MIPRTHVMPYMVKRPASESYMQHYITRNVIGYFEWAEIKQSFKNKLTTISGKLSIPKAESSLQNIIVNWSVTSRVHELLQWLRWTVHTCVWQKTVDRLTEKTTKKITGNIIKSDSKRWSWNTRHTLLVHRLLKNMHMHPNQIWVKYKF